jgi:hypothetical protein
MSQLKRMVGLCLVSAGLAMAGLAVGAFTGRAGSADLTPPAANASASVPAVNCTLPPPAGVSVAAWCATGN